MLTTFDLDEYVYEALRAGAGGFLLKDASPARLAEAVRTVAAGEALFAPSVTRRLVERFVRRAPAGDGLPPGFARPDGPRGRGRPPDRPRPARTARSPAGSS